MHLGIELLVITSLSVMVLKAISTGCTLQEVVWVRVDDVHLVLGVISSGNIVLGVVPEGVVLLGVVPMVVEQLWVMKGGGIAVELR